jgi:phosphoribosyl-ATP pyrophosphohydrolase
MSNPNIDFLITLEKVIEERKTSGGDESYTAQLLAAGSERIAQKVGEEGVELALAGAQRERDKVIAEAADLLYHVLVLLKDCDLGLADVTDELERRHRQS